MQLHAATLKPASAALGKLGRLGYFRHSKQAFIKGASLLFPAGRQRQLDVIDGNERCYGQSGHTDMLAENLR